MILMGVLPKIFLNQNKALERTYEMIEPMLKGVKQTSHDIEKQIRKSLQRTSSADDINEVTPQKAGSTLARMWAVLTPVYKPQQGIGLGSVRKYEYNREHPMTEIRSGTMAERHGFARYNPIFAAWVSSLTVQDQQQVSHVYFNNLALDRIDPEGSLEVNLTKALHHLEDQPFNRVAGQDAKRKIAVITLPAEKHRFEKSNLTNNLLTVRAEQFRRSVVSEIAHPRPNTHQSSETGKDFFISPAICALVFQDADPEIMVQELFNNSLRVFGLSESKMLSPREATLVYFHFIKYELTNFILEKLQPTSYQMSCKHGIDRGGVSSVYYHLMKSLACGKPLSKQEFEMGLHAAPTMVQGRGMNTHSHLIWAIVDLYIKSNPNAVPAWLITWCKENEIEYKNTTLDQMKKLRHYITVVNNTSEKLGFIKKQPHQTKIAKLAAATWLADNASKNYSELSHDEFNGHKACLLDGELRDILESFLDSGYFSGMAKMVMLDRLSTYITAKPLKHNPHSTGYLSDKNKIATAQWLIAIVNAPQSAELGLEFEKHEKTLRDGELGSIFSYLTKHGLVPSSYELHLQHLASDWVQVNSPPGSPEIGKG